MPSFSRRRLGGLLALVGVILLGLGLLFRPQPDARVLTWMPQIRAAAAEAGIDPDLLAGLVYAESRGKADAVSRVGALGLCQLMPPTAAELAAGLHIEGPPYTPADNLRMGATYLAQMLRQRQGDLDLALLSYRLGPSRASRRMEEAGGRDAWFRLLQQRDPSPWGYRDQILEARTRYASRHDPSDAPFRSGP